MTEFETLQDDIREIKRDLRDVLKTLNGNGQHGIKTRLAILEKAAANAERLKWLILGAGVTSVLGAIVSAIAAMWHGS